MVRRNKPFCGGEKAEAEVYRQGEGQDAVGYFAMFLFGLHGASLLALTTLAGSSLFINNYLTFSRVGLG